MGCTQRPQSDNQARRTSVSCTEAPRWGQAGNQAEKQGSHPGLARQAQGQAQVAPGISSGPPPALLLTPPAGTQAHRWGSRMPDNGLGGQTSLWYGHGVGLPGPARPSPDSQPQSLSQAGRQFSPFNPSAAGLAFPAPLFLSGSSK